MAHSKLCRFALFFFLITSKRKPLIQTITAAPRDPLCHHSSTSTLPPAMALIGTVDDNRACSNALRPRAATMSCTRTVAHFDPELHDDGEAPRQQAPEQWPQRTPFFSYDKRQQALDSSPVSPKLRSQFFFNSEIYLHCNSGSCLWWLLSPLP